MFVVLNVTYTHRVGDVHARYSAVPIEGQLLEIVIAIVRPGYLEMCTQLP